MHASAAGASGDASGWTQCAGENGTCTFTGVRAVRYGTSDRWVEKNFNGSAACGNSTFGDPAMGVVKACSYSNVSWTACAAEGGTCAFSGTREVRYGTLDAYAVKSSVAGSVACTNAVFGDPKMGVAKTCWYSSVVAAAAAQTACDEALPALPALPASYKLVTSFCPSGKCAKADDDIDDTDAIDAALDQSAGSFLVFPPGKYLISRSLRVKQRGVTMWGPGATIHATNADDQSIIVEANDVSIYSFRLTAVTGQRGSRAEHTRIAIYGPASVNPIVTNTVIRNNQIVNAGEPGTNLANSATGAGIFVNAADGFLIAGNTVARSLADGIHLTGGARNGRVVGNTVRETGDDMIAVVSYAYPDPANNTASTIAGSFAASMARYQDRNILISGNTLSGQYWGRGIAVVGGRDITIRGNTLSNIPYAAAVMLARETSSGSYGVDNVLVENNSITDVQTLKPPYDFGNKFASNARTGHGAIEVHSSVFNDELNSAALAAGFTVGNLTLRNNSVTSSATPGVRVGVGTGTSWTMGSRAVTGNAPMANIGIAGNALRGVGTGTPIQILAAGGTASCSGNTVDGANAAAARCTAAVQSAPATGAASICTTTTN